MEVKRRKAEQTEFTRAALIGSGRELFGERGYAAVGTEEIVQRAGVTRGALYHHFRGKEDLFRAVLEEMNRELAERIGSVAAEQPDPVHALRVGAQAFLDACLEPAVQRIALIDAPSVLGWEKWRELDAEAGLGLVEAVLEAAMEAKLIERQPVKPLAHILLGALDEAAMLVARADDVRRTRAEVGEAVDRVLSWMQASGGRA